MAVDELFHRYFVCLRGETANPIPWDPREDRHDIEIDCNLAYFGQALAVFDRDYREKPLTVYLTWDNPDELPSYGEDVVALLLGDEDYRLPKYFGRVKAVFKCFGVTPTLGINPLRHRSYLGFSLVLQYLRNWACCLPVWLPYQAARWQARLKRRRPPTIHDLPMGYYKQLELPIVPIDQRSVDVFFAGSVNNQLYSRWSIKRWLEPPKTIARRTMLATLDELRPRHPELTFNLGTIADFNEARVADAQSYSAQLMNTRVCLVPRGTTPETYRYYEAMRYGCVLVTDRMPKRWFYDGAPTVTIDDWNDVERVLVDLLADEAALVQRHEASLAWWAERCSEAALGRHLASVLRSV